MVAVLACGLPMIAWSLGVDRVHRNPSTGIDWDRPRPPRAETREISITKLVGLWCTWAIIAAAYCVGRWYWQGNYRFAMQMLAALVPLLIVGSIPYVLWLDRRLIDPRDGAWHFGLWLTGRGDRADRGEIAGHARAWAVKGFFTAFMISGVPQNWAWLINYDLSRLGSGPAALAAWLIGMMFLIDMAMATVGYLLTMRPLDAHIRSANPYAAAWAAALICYPPFGLMNPGGPLDYHRNGAEWDRWLAGHGWLLAADAVALVGLTAVYAWATVAFGPRFSNLTNRGILTHGPYRWTKHPAYLAKNLFWWGSSLPILATSGHWLDSVRNTALLAVVSGVYYWRARTEERHLMADPAYRAYAAWMDANAPIPRLLRACGIAPRPAPIPTPAGSVSSSVRRRRG
ncbi:MAG: DUF1295 domain-containing protein [Sphingomonas sp.]